MLTENYHRDITHTKYLNKKLWDKGPQSWLQKEITDIPIRFTIDNTEFLNEDYWAWPYNRGSRTLFIEAISLPPKPPQNSKKKGKNTGRIRDFATLKIT